MTDSKREAPQPPAAEPVVCATTSPSSMPQFSTLRRNFKFWQRRSVIPDNPPPAVFPIPVNSVVDVKNEESDIHIEPEDVADLGSVDEVMEALSEIEQVLATNSNSQQDLVDQEPENSLYSDEDPLSALTSSVMTVLYPAEDSSGRWSRFWTTIEDATQSKRETIIFAGLGIVGTLMLLLNLGNVLIGITSIGYPLLETSCVLTQANPSLESQQHWLQYWSIFGCVQVMEMLFFGVPNTIPLYQLLKVLFLLGAALPSSYLADYVYYNFVAPVVKWVSKVVNKYVL